ncbi:LuxR family two component transcriptional regulator [Vibrio crassostreae]|uniref:response regulator transcription factor n=1 Tax=Vibrio crassostreae TaxID=246167 RepID=UPI000F49A9AC|nr:response regulator transcription factor [Vibrio crassostreae]ROO67529.1 LuxR family two component transcriptional regulator [Vibrio crassostreae]ROP13110.1 LuxR family two component transcriptional regulator [Vibrio crassostreae]ROQ87185.1 LuxR family two component transcriptional regulator [Vibrio crassostreae]ROR88444.1 LuxR family two component transcriptional regulator [Vibrio crassostreae]RPE89982.1 LuxR family two component transcriptional regulator [Vibrio crassostreae]
MLSIQPKRCLVIDSFPLVRETLSQQLLSLETVAEVKESCSVADTLSQLKKERFDLLTMDVELGQDNGFELMKRAKATGYQGKILFISRFDYSLYSALAKKNGANGYISKTEPTLIVRDAMSHILRGYNLFKQDDSKVDINTDNLSSRELTVFQYLIKGYSNKQIAGLLFLSEKTISTYKSRVLSKFSASTVVELIKINELISLNNLH